MTRSAKSRAKFACLLAIIVLAAATSFAEPVSSLKPTNYVNDFAGVLDAATQSKLNALCYEVEQKAGAQMAVVTVKSTDSEDVFQYAVDLYQKWGIGKKGNDRGVLILLATQDHKYYTSVGYGLEPILPDGKVGGFGREMVPLLKSGDYNGAVTQITTQIAQVIAQDRGVTLENQPRLRPHRPNTARPIGSGGVVVIAIIIIVFIISAIMSAISRGGPRGGGGSGFLSGLLWGMLFDSVTRPRGYGGWGGGGFGGGGFGGGGFGGGGGGFGGFGGGSTGGGGAGGSW
jgi:uncharacterized protein